MLVVSCNLSELCEIGSAEVCRVPYSNRRDEMWFVYISRYVGEGSCVVGSRRHMVEGMLLVVGGEGVLLVVDVIWGRVCCE
jgi:hypothetical protein